MPFLTLEFTPQQKLTFLTAIFGITSNPVALSQLLVTNFRSTFVTDAQSGLTLPPLITGALSTVPVAPPTSSGLPAGDLMLGSSGSAVVSLQQFLIAKAIGPAAARLAGAGATGNFGPITEAALIEYQSAAGISPANGYYGSATRAAVTANAAAQPPATTTGTSTFTRDLYYGVSGQDVLGLQILLNTHGYTVASSGAGSSGNETTYFGPATQSAVIRFQLARRISPAVCYVGPLTRAALATL
jgi:peptidoglycan hydrolase-like protein with peptidoglycan-binding domain